MFVWLYRLLLATLPRDFRARFGAELIATAQSLDRDRPRGAWRTARALADVIVTPIRLRADLRHERRQFASTERTPHVEPFVQDIHFAIRGLRREKAFVAFVVVTLALGIGANAAMFGIADRLLIRGPAHVRDADQVVRVYYTVRPAGMREFTSSGFGYVAYDALRRGNHTFEALALCAVIDGVHGEGESARPAKIGYASAGLFPLLGVHPARGRFFSDDEDAATGAAQVAVISDGAWRAWLGGDEHAVGKTVRIGDEPFVVIGVAPPGFTGPQLGRVDAWLPANLLGARTTQNFTTSWNAQWTQIIARLRPGVSAEAAGLDATDVYRRGYLGGDAAEAAARLSVASLRADDAGRESSELRILRWLVGVAVVVLLIAGANVANLLLARGMKRRREVAIRAALGAGRWRLARLLLIESVLLAMAGSALGLVVALVVGGAARHVLFDAVEWTSSPVNGRVLAMAFLVAVATGTLIGAIPAIAATRTGLTEALKSGARDGGGRRWPLRTALTIVQAALAVLLLVGAGLFVRSLWLVRSLDLGFDADAVVIVEVSRPSLATYPTGPARDAERQRRRTFYFDALDRIRALPGVERAGVAIGTPFGNRFTVKLRVPGIETVPRLKSGGPGVSAVGGDYFATMGTSIVRGRTFGPRDGAGTEPVTIVSELMASTIWPGADPLGQCLLIGDGTPGCARVVGVAENTYRSRLREDPVMHYYIPAGQEVGFGGAALLIRSRGDAIAMAADVRRLLTASDASITYVDAETIQARIDPQLRPWRLGATILALSGGLALLVAAIGIYSVMSYLIADRRREIGVRLALGARTPDILRLVVRGSLLMAAIGIVIGEALAAALGRFVAPLLFETSPRDPLVFAAIAVLLGSVALVATVAPANRARRVSPVEVLRAD
jgi:predicted permease